MDEKDIGLLLLGWLFGMLSPAVVEANRRRRDLAPMQHSLADELHEFRYTAACTASVFRKHLGTADKQFNLWFKDTALSYSGLQQSERFREVTRMVAELDEETTNALRDYQAKPDRALKVKKLHVPALEARVPVLWMFPSGAQSELLRLLAEVSIYNQEVDDAREAHKFTFELAGANHDRARENLVGTYGHLAHVAMRVADQAGRCEVGLKSGKWPRVEGDDVHA